MSRTHRHKSFKEKKSYIGMNHNKRFNHDAWYAVDDPRANHTYDRGRIEGNQRRRW